MPCSRAHIPACSRHFAPLFSPRGVLSIPPGRGSAVCPWRWSGSPALRRRCPKPRRQWEATAGEPRWHCHCHPAPPPRELLLGNSQPPEALRLLENGWTHFNHFLHEQSDYSKIKVYTMLREFRCDKEAGQKHLYRKDINFLSRQLYFFTLAL